MSGFWNSINHTVAAAFGDITSVFTGAEATVDDVAKQGFNTANNAINQTGSVIKGGEMIIAVPLIILAVGIGYFLVSDNAGKAIEVVGNKV